MARTNWQELVTSVEDGLGTSTTGDGASPPKGKNGESSSKADTAKRDVLRDWRRSKRVPVEIPVDVCVCGEEQEPVFVRGKTLDVSAHGALLDVTITVDVGQTLRLRNARTKREIECHVLRFAKRYPEGGGQIGVEFAGVSRHFWDIASPPADWDPSWVPGTRPKRLIPPAFSLPKSAAEGSPQAKPRIEKSWRTNFEGVARAVEQFLKNWRAHKRLAAAMAGSVVLFAFWLGIHGSGDTTTTVNAGIAPEDATMIPRVERTRLATSADFDPDAISWLRDSGLEAGGKIPGFYSGSKKSNAYILVGQANERRVVLLAGGGLRYNAEYPNVAIAACVPMELVRRVNWADASPPESDGDGLLIVRAGDAPASGVMLFLRGSRVIVASPVDYRQVKFGQGCQP